MEKARRIDLCARLWHDKKSERAYEACQRRDVISMKIRKYRTSDLPVIIELWNSVVEAGDAFPQEELLNEETGAAFFAAQSCTVVLEEDDQVLGLYILHPNNVGRCSHIANASYAIDASVRGKHLGEALVFDSIRKARALGFQILQFNAVVESNTHARHLYERIGFQQLGVIPGGFRMKNGKYENICPYYYEL